MLTGRQIAFTINSFLKIKRRSEDSEWHERRALHGVGQRQYQKFDEARENIPTASEKEPENDLLRGLYHRQLEKSTYMKSVLALHHSDQIHRKEPNSYMEFKAMVTDVLKNHQHNSLTAQKKCRVKNTAISVATVTCDGDRKTNRL